MTIPASFATPGLMLILSLVLTPFTYLIIYVDDVLAADPSETALDELVKEI